MSLQWDAVLSVKCHSHALAMVTAKPGTVQMFPVFFLSHLGLKHSIQ